MKKKVTVILSMLFLVLSVEAFDRVQDECKTEMNIPEYAITETTIIKQLDDYVIPSAITWQRDSTKYDIYLSLNEIPGRNTGFIFYSIEPTEHIKYDVSNQYIAYLNYKGYNLFLDRNITKIYAKPTGKSKEFKVDNSLCRQDPDDCSALSFWIIGPLQNPEGFRLKMKAYYIESNQASHAKAFRVKQ